MIRMIKNRDLNLLFKAIRMWLLRKLKKIRMINKLIMFNLLKKRINFWNLNLTNWNSTSIVWKINLKLKKNSTKILDLRKLNTQAQKMSLKIFLSNVLMKWDHRCKKEKIFSKSTKSFKANQIKKNQMLARRKK